MSERLTVVAQAASDAFASQAGIQIPRLPPLQLAHPIVVDQRAMQRVMADINGDHMGGTGLQQHLGEAAGRGADVERGAARPIEPEGGKTCLLYKLPSPRARTRPHIPSSA